MPQPELSSSNLEQKIQHIQNNFDDLDRSMILFYRDFANAQTITKTEIAALETKIAYLETLATFSVCHDTDDSTQHPLPPPFHSIEPEQLRPSPQPPQQRQIKHQYCHCTIL